MQSHDANACLCGKAFRALGGCGARCDFFLTEDGPSTLTSSTPRRVSLRSMYPLLWENMHGTFILRRYQGIGSLRTKMFERNVKAI